MNGIPGWADLRRLDTERRRDLLALLVVAGAALLIGAGIAAMQDQRRQAEILSLLGRSGLGEPSTFGRLLPGILVRNVAIAFVLVGAGLWLRALPWVVVTVNGCAVGFFGSCAAAQSGLGFLTVYLLPYGALQVAVMLIAGAIGLRLGAWKDLAEHERIDPGELRWLARCLWLVVPLVVAAALLETLIARTYA